ncbi:MAG: hypothetical protein ACFFED_01940 [Candidatus Thorarchaeota archaeon]
MSEIGYDDIRELWKDEKDRRDLGYLEDLKLSKVIKYLSKIRQSLAEIPSDNALQVELLQEEGINVEFMVKDLLMIRRNKILRIVLNAERMTGSMTLAEEEFYNRLLRAVESHSEFINEAIMGKPVPTITKSKSKKTEKTAPVKEDIPEDEALEYIMVRFLRPIEDAIVGLDEVVYGPFEKEDVATIPTANAKTWLSDGTAVRIMPSKSDGDT